MRVWIRNPAWDGFWLLSGFPLGAALLGLSFWISGVLLVFWIILAVQTGHTLAPMALAWSHGRFRALMMERWVKFIVVPVFILMVATLLGALGGRYLPNLRFNPQSFAIATGPQTLADLLNPFLAMVALYAVWNAYHFGKQAFGVLSLYRRMRGGGGSRRLDLFYSCAVVWAAMGMPFIPSIAGELHNTIGWPVHAHPFLDNVRLGYLAAAVLLPAGMLLHEWFTTRSLPRAIFILTDGLALALVFHFGLWGFAIIAMNHWLVAVGLASHVHANHREKSPWPFAIAIMVAGFALFCLLFVDLHKLPTVGLTTATLYFTVAAVSFRLGLGFVHFLYDRWLYKFSDPCVRETIGSDMFSISTQHIGVIGDGSLSWSRR